MTTNKNLDNTTTSNTPFKLTLFNVKKGVATKSFTPDGEGLPVKSSTSPYITEAESREQSFSCLADLPQTFTELKHNQCLGYGITGNGYDNIVTEKELNSGNAINAIARTHHFFHYPEKAFAYLDFDTYDVDKFKLTPEKAIALIQSAIPEFKDVQFLARYSVSSCFKSKKDGKWIKPPKSFHLYFAVNDGENIPLLKDLIMQKMWLAGYGYIKLSKPSIRNGVQSRIKRCPIDCAVFQAERVDFAGGAKYPQNAHFYQDLPEPKLMGGTEPLTISNIPVLTEHELARFDNLVNEAKGIKRKTVKKNVVNKLKNANPQLNNKELSEKADKLIERHESGILEPFTEILFYTGETFTVKQLLDMDLIDGKHPYDGCVCADPDEPDYSNGVCAYFNWNHGKNPNIFSFAHGEKIYTFRKRLLFDPNTKERIDSELASLFDTEFYEKRYIDDDFVKKVLSNPSILTCLKFTHGTGKTNTFIKGLVKHYSTSNEIVLIICHRVLLSLDISKRVAVIDYRDESACNAGDKLLNDNEPNFEKIFKSIGFSLVVNSLTNEKYSTLVDNASIVVFEEADQVFSQTTGGTIELKEQPVLLNKIEKVCQQTKRVFLLSAGLKAPLIQTFEKFTNSKAKLYIGKYQAGINQKVRFFPTEHSIEQSFLNDIEKNKIYLTVDCSLEKQELLFEKINTLYPDKKVELFNSEQNLKSKLIHQYGEKESKLKNIDDYLCDIEPDVVIASPTLGSGISIDKYKFDKVYGISTGTVVPDFFLQQIRRIRYAKDYNLHIPKKVHAPREFNAETIYKQKKAVYDALRKQDTQYLTIEFHGEKLPVAISFNIETLNLRMRVAAQNTAQENYDFCHFEQVFCELLAYDGVTNKNVEYVDSDSNADAKASRIEQKMLKDVWIKNIQNAPDLPNDNKENAKKVISRQKDIPNTPATTKEIRHSLNKFYIQNATDKKELHYDLIARFYKNRGFKGLKLREILTSPDNVLMSHDTLERESGLRSKDILSDFFHTKQLLKSFLAQFNITVEDGVICTENALSYSYQIDKAFINKVISKILAVQKEWNKLIGVTIHKGYKESPDKFKPVHFINAVFKKLHIDYDVSHTLEEPQHRFSIDFKTCLFRSNQVKKDVKISIYTISTKQKVSLKGHPFRYKGLDESLLKKIEIELGMVNKEMGLANVLSTELNKNQKKKLSRFLHLMLVSRFKDVAQRANWLATARLVLTNRQFVILTNKFEKDVASNEAADAVLNFVRESFRKIKHIEDEKALKMT